jgi:hypothetical protein
MYRQLIYYYKHKKEILNIRGDWVHATDEPIHKLEHYGGNIYIDIDRGCYIIYRKVGT